jgi:hypothetical protein
MTLILCLALCVLLGAHISRLLKQTHASLTHPTLGKREKRR